MALRGVGVRTITSDKGLSTHLLAPMTRLCMAIMLTDDLESSAS